MEASASVWEVDPRKRQLHSRWEHALWHTGESSEQHQGTNKCVPAIFERTQVGSEQVGSQVFL